MIFLELLWTFFKIGLFTFGGGLAMLPLIQSAVESHGWLTSEQIVNFIAVSESTPGPFAINMSTYVGSEIGGIFGAFCATLGVVLPSFTIILIVAKFYEKFKTNSIVEGCMSGLKPAVIGLIGAAVISLFRTVFLSSGFRFTIITQPWFLVSIMIFLLMTALSFKKVHPILIICFSAIIGIVTGYLLDIPV